MFRAATAGIDTTPYVNEIMGLGGDGGEDEEAAAAQAAIADMGAE